MMDAEGSDRLPGAVPYICGPGDVAITNRQIVHGSFANTSPNIRVTLNAGFHRRKSVYGIESGGVHNPVSFYDDEYITRRARLLMYGIDARQKRFPEETPYVYAPLADQLLLGNDTRYPYRRMFTRLSPCWSEDDEASRDEP